MKQWPAPCALVISLLWFSSGPAAIASSKSSETSIRYRDGRFRYELAYADDRLAYDSRGRQTMFAARACNRALLSGFWSETQKEARRRPQIVADRPKKKEATRAAAAKPASRDERPTIQIGDETRWDWAYAGEYFRLVPQKIEILKAQEARACPKR